MKILHIADIHLDRPFVGLSPSAAAAQRRNLFDAFRRALALGRERAVDLVTIGGDLWEEEHVRADTRASVAHELAALALPVLIICGNHDPLLAGGSYRRTTWPRNVQIAPIRTLHRFDFDSIAIWAVSWGGGDLSARALEHLEIPADGCVHLALLHGTAPTNPFAEETDTYFPFDPASLREAGITQVLAGHIHQASDHDGVVYPGSPEPLGWGDHGRHCIALLEIGGDGLTTELIDLNKTTFETREVDCSGCESSAAVAARLTGLNEDPDLFLRVRLVGEIAPDCEIDVANLAISRGGNFASLEFVDATEPMLDIAARIERKSLDGLFTRKLLKQIESAQDPRARRIAQMALEAGLRAVERRERVLRVG